MVAPFVSGTPGGGAALVDLDDVQGLLWSGYGKLKAAFLLLRIEDAGRARQWLARCSDEVTTARAADASPPRALHVALTADGLAVLAVPDDVRAQFATEFQRGMASDDARARRLGDVGANDPCRWDWGVGPRAPHVAVLLYAACDALEPWRASVTTQCLAAGFSLVTVLATANEQRFEPFGFRDGISQPELDWDRRRPVVDRDRLSYDNLSCLGEFVLGYPNDYGLYTPRPVVLAARDPDGLLPRAEDAPDRADVGRNGSYLVIRQLQQDVEGFGRELDRHARGDATLREELAAAMVGRTKDGVPLVGTDGDTNAFTYDDDPRGVRCPLGAHIRRANPRNADLPARTRGIVARLWRMLGFDAAALERDVVASTRFHRLLRRGRRYGADDASGDVGIHFACLVGNIKRQFEFVQSAWIMGGAFAGLHGERDPLLGHREPYLDGAPTDAFSRPRPEGPDRRVCGLPQFVTVKGGAYFFLPGIAALRYLAGASRRVP